MTRWLTSERRDVRPRARCERLAAVPEVGRRRLVEGREGQRQFAPRTTAAGTGPATATGACESSRARMLWMLPCEFLCHSWPSYTLTEGIRDATHNTT